MSWNIYGLAYYFVTQMDDPRDVGPTVRQICKLNNQRCLWCSGWGHGARDCPTKVKIDQLKLGVREQAKVLEAVQKATREAMPVTPLALKSNLSVRRKPKLGKRSRGEIGFLELETNDGSN